MKKPVMTISNMPISLWRKGDKVSAKKLNEPIQVLLAYGTSVSPGKQTINTGQRKTLTVERFIITAQGGQIETADYIYCTRPGDTSGGFIVVAKPHLLRRTPFDGVTIDGVEYTYTAHEARTAVDDEGTESQVVVPNYVAGDEILAIRSPTGGSGLVITVNGVNKVIEWLDLNSGGRAWAEVEE